MSSKIKIELKKRKINSFEIFLKSFKVLGYFVSVSLLGFYVYTISRKYTIDPDISLSQRAVPARSIPFPAITICSPLIMHSRLANINEYFESIFPRAIVKNMSSDEQNYLAVKTQICAPAIAKYIVKGIDNRTEKNILKLLKNSALEVNETLKWCINNFITFNCEKMFNRILTEYGFCNSFNMQGYKSIFNDDIISSDFDSYKRTKIVKSLNLTNDKYHELLDDENVIEQWTLNSGYTCDNNEIPYRATRNNDYMFFMAIKESDNYDLCHELKGTYLIIFHLPNELPTFFHPHEYLRIDAEGYFVMSATVLKSDKNLAKYPLEKRGCYFHGERHLQFFKEYTQVQCKFECLTNFTLKVCGCVKYSMPRQQGTEVCDIDKADCYRNVMNNWPDEDEMTKNPAMPCDCYPPCKNIKYNVEHSSVVPLIDENSVLIKMMKKKQKQVLA